MEISSALITVVQEPRVHTEEQDNNIKELASILHEVWRKSLQIMDGKYKPRVRKTTDQAWITKYNTDQVDIANTDYVNLPLDWQAENYATAAVITDAIEYATAKNIELDDKFVETTSNVVHIKWLERHGDNVSKSQGVTYESLNEREKAKDRDMVIKGIELYKNTKTQKLELV